MTDHIALCWQPDRPAEDLPSVQALVARLLAITADTTPDSGIAAVLAKPTGQKMIVIVAGPYWCLDWFPEDYHDRGCIGSYHTVARDVGKDSQRIITYYIQGHHGECLAGHTVQMADAIRAIQSFLTSAERPDGVEWEMD